MARTLVINRIAYPVTLTTEVSPPDTDGTEGRAITTVSTAARCPGCGESDWFLYSENSIECYVCGIECPLTTVPPHIATKKGN